MKIKNAYLIIISGLVLIALACQAINFTPSIEPTPTLKEQATPIPATPLPPQPVQGGEKNPEEPVFIIGTIPYTSPFFPSTFSAPFVMLEDQAGFIQRNREFEFPLTSQVIGAVEIHDDDTLTYSLALPSVPQGTQVDVDNDGEEDKGVQIFGVAYWSNVWGGPFLERRDGTGWSNAYTSTITDPERDDEIIGGLLIVWAPDDQQKFPTDFGSDDKLFTADDPTAPLPAGYNVVNLDQKPFEFYKQAQPEITLNEGVIAVNDYKDMNYGEAFTAMYEKVSREYPFTKEKNIDWDALYNQFEPRARSARNSDDYYRAIHDFTLAIPDAHVGVSFNGDVFFEEQGGSLGIILAELSTGEVIVTQIMPDTPANNAGIKVGAKIITWNGQPVSEAISKVNPFLGPYSTDHHRRLEQVIFLTRMPPGSDVTIEYKNPGDTSSTKANLTAEVEYDSLFKAMPSLSLDDLILPVQGEVLDESGLGYIQITSFSEDYNLTAKLWEYFITTLIDNEIPGLIIDVRINPGGSGGLALDFAGYFFDEEILLSRESYYNELSGEFEYEDPPTRIRPAPAYYEGPIAVLVSPYCVSACEGFVNALKQNNQVIVVGHYPTAGAFGEVGRGQYDIPGNLSLQFPTGRPETPDGKLLIEGQGIPLDITVPVTEDSALGRIDSILQAAIKALLKEIQ